MIAKMGPEDSDLTKRSVYQENIGVHETYLKYRFKMF